MKRRTGVIAGVLLLAIATLLWQCHGHGTRSSGTASGSAGTRAASSGGTEPHRHVDPRTLARGSIAGTVTDERHAPVAHARVCLDTMSNDLSDELTREPRCTTSDERGRYVLPDLFAAEYHVSAMAKPFRPAVYHPGGDPAQTLLALAAGERRTDIDLVLRDGGVAITGTVSDVTGGPIAHAVVRASSTYWGDGDATPAVETDDAGKFELWVAPGPVQLAAFAEGYAPGSDFGNAPGAFEILLAPESSIAGTVIDGRTHQPIAGVAVEVALDTWKDTRGSDFTDEHGRFRVTHLEPGRYVAVARAASGYGRSDGSIRVGLGQHVEDVVIALHPAYRIEGRVVLPDGKKSTCKLAALSLHDAGEAHYLTADREPDGTLHVEGVLPGSYDVEVTCTGYLERDKYPPVVIAGKDATGLEWPVDLGATIRGHVKSKAGAPIDDADVSLRSVGDGRGRPLFRADRSTRDGSYKLEGLQAGKYEVTVLSTQGQAPDGWRVEVRAGATVEQDLVLDGSGAIAGVVVDAQGRPAGGVHVMAWGQDPSNDTAAASVRTSDDGSFTVGNLPAGSYRVIAFHRDRDVQPGGDSAKQAEPTTVHVGQTAKVRLVLEAVTGTIRGSVVDPDGKPVSDAFVAAAREADGAGDAKSAVADTRWDADDRPVVSGLDGKFALTELSPGKYTIRAYRKGGGEAIAEHVPVGGTVKLQLQRTGSISGTVTRAGGVPDELDIEIHELRTDYGRNEVFYKTGGKYEIRDLPPGHFTITVEAAHGHKEATVELAEGEAKTGVDIELDPLVTITGRVVELGTTRPVASIAMAASAGFTGGGDEVEGGGDDRQYVTDDAGRFAVANTPIGQITISGRPLDADDSPYALAYAVRTITGTGTIDIGDVPIARRRIGDHDKAGTLGIQFVEQPDDTPPDQERFEISSIDPAGPAAGTALKVGDVITTVDGLNVTGVMHTFGETLMEAPPGTKLTFGLARSIAVAIVLGPP